MKRKTIIIAEAGVNHNGNIELAKKLIDVASDAGADYVKFQTFRAENLVSKSALMADYQRANTNSSASQYEILKKLELSESNHEELIICCKSKKIKFLSTAFDLESIDLLKQLKIDLFKIPSGEITNYPYLKKIGALKKQVILSTGMSTIKEIGEALSVLIKSGTKKSNITVLHCNTEYPTPMKDVNLFAMQTIGEKFNVAFGYSDHTLGIEVPIAAVALGAKVIEKHFTLNRNMAGPDHKASLEPSELKQMILSIRNTELALGNGEKKPGKSEIKNIAFARKSIHLSRKMKRGERILENDLVMKRPGNGISPMKMKLIIGKKIKYNFPEEYKLTWKDINV